MNEIQVEAVRALSSEGLSQRVVAERVGVSQASVSRALAAPVSESGPLAAAVAEFLAPLELNALNEVRAAITLALAEKLDGCVRATSGMAASALPRLASLLLQELELLGRGGEVAAIGTLRLNPHALLREASEATG